MPNVVNDRLAPLLDLDHLRAQTAGDAQLGADLLGLFLSTTETAMEELRDCAPADGPRRGDCAHRLRGAALAVGAYRFAAAAASLEAAVSQGARDELERIWTATRSAVAAALADDRLRERLASPRVAR